MLGETTTSERVLPILHWFSDNVSVAKKATEHGCYFSINHRMLVADSAIKVVRYLPSDRLLTETDAPFTEIDGRKTEPRDVPTTIEKLAELRAVSVAEMSETLHANASRVFAFVGLDHYWLMLPSVQELCKVRSKRWMLKRLVPLAGAELKLFVPRPKSALTRPGRGLGGFRRKAAEGLINETDFRGNQVRKTK